MEPAGERDVPLPSLSELRLARRGRLRPSTCMPAAVGSVNGRLQPRAFGVLSSTTASSSIAPLSSLPVGCDRAQTSRLWTKHQPRREPACRRRTPARAFILARCRSTLSHFYPEVDRLAPGFDLEEGGDRREGRALKFNWGRMLCSPRSAS